MKGQLESKNSELAGVSEEVRERSTQLSALRDRTDLWQQNWLKEKEDLLEQESYLQAEFEQAKEAMHNWEILAMEERSIRENLGEKVADLEEQLSSLQEAYGKTTVDRDSQAATVDGLQRALQEIQTGMSYSERARGEVCLNTFPFAARKQELRELVESSDAQLEEVRQALRDAESKASEADSTLQTARNELERVRPFEKEVREKNLLIGKLRHEAVTLNDHLTKALRFLKKGKPEDNVDRYVLHVPREKRVLTAKRHIVTNHLLHFLTLDRSDPKKFQILQLIAALLGWSDGERLENFSSHRRDETNQRIEQREQAGLARPGTSTANRLKLPGTSRTPSGSTLLTEMSDSGTRSNSKESLAELWSNFLEQEAAQAGQSASRRGSQTG